MLSETFVAAASSPPQLTSATTAILKDAGIFIHAFQPQPALRSTFKKSVTAPNCVAISQIYIFAAQSQKATVHVYNREKGNHEATIPFPERIHSLTLVCDDTVLALGVASGSIIFWEICTGRMLSTPQSHLQPVNVLAVDLKSNFLLSGSLDSNIHVWSLLDLLSFPSGSAILTDESAQPRHTLSDHRSAITALAVGHSALPTNIAVSASDDQTTIVWNYQSGERLRTFLLPSSPLCLALDPADRAFYTGYRDGSIQLVSFYSINSKTSIHDIAHASTPIQPSSSSRYFLQLSDSDSSAPTSDRESDSTLSLSLSYDGTTVITGHASGKINAWSIASSGSSTSTIAQYTGAPITSIHFLPPEGWPKALPPKLKTTTIVKPKPHESFSGSKGQLSGAYTFSTLFPSRLSDVKCSALSRKRRRGACGPAAFEEALISPFFTDRELATSTVELVSWNSNLKNSSAPNTSATASANGVEAEQDFVSLGDHGSDSSMALAENAERIAHLEKQVAHLRELQSLSHKHVRDLVNENKKLQTRRLADHSSTESMDVVTGAVKARSSHPDGSEGAEDEDAD